MIFRKKETLAVRKRYSLKKAKVKITANQKMRVIALVQSRIVTLKKSILRKALFSLVPCWPVQYNVNSVARPEIFEGGEGLKNDSFAALCIQSIETLKCINLK